MSGGHFDYDQYKIGYIAESIETQIEKNGRRKTEEELRQEPWVNKEWLERNPGHINHYEYPPEVIEKFKEAVNLLHRAQIYAHRIDWLLSGDDGEESFLRRLKEDLSNHKEL
jgi:hypothetical protein